MTQRETAVPPDPSPTTGEATDLEQLLATLDRTTDGQRQNVCIGDIIAAVGSRSFAPLLMLIGVLIASPLSGVPGLPTLGAVIVVLVSAQMLLGRKHFWLPRWVLLRCVPRQRMSEVIHWLNPPARFVDKLLKPRLEVMVIGPGSHRRDLPAHRRGHALPRAHPLFIIGGGRHAVGLRPGSGFP